MAQYTLIQVEVSGIQSYVFGSNNLRQNIGASELVARSTTEWVVEVLDKIVGESKHNARWSEKVGFVSFIPTTTDMEAEVIYAAGGNALIRFNSEPGKHAIPFTQNLTRCVVKEARGLNMLVAHQSFDWETDVLSAVHQALRRKIGQQKFSKRPDTPLLGLGVTMAGDFSGQPAVGTDNFGNPVSTIAQHKLARSEPEVTDGKAEPEEEAKKANYRLHHVLEDSLPADFHFVRDFDLFGEKGESSYIAVVHIDGNGMGKRFQAIAQAHPTPADNDAYIKQLRALSLAVQDKSIQALKAAVKLVLKGVREDKIPLKHGKRHIPFRPIIFGGDDTTFITDGRYGLALAVKYLQSLAQGALPGEKAGVDGDPLFARAGIAIVKTHYPFSRAYELAEELAASAKKALKDLPDEKGITLDWHIATSGVVLPLSEVRKQQYIANTGNSLLMRPMHIDQGEPLTGSRYWRSWRTFEDVIYQFQHNSNEWAGKRNKILALREALRGGREEVWAFRKKFQQGILPGFKDHGQMAEEGWAGEDCGYFDAIEALDFYERL